MKRMCLIIICLSIAKVALADECVVGGAGLIQALGEAKKGGCVSDNAALRERYGEFYPGVTEFRVIKWKKSDELSINDALAPIESDDSKPLVIAAEKGAEVTLTGHGAKTGLILQGKKIIIDNLTIEGFADTGILIKGEDNLIIESRVMKNGADGIRVEGRANKIVTSEIANNAINGIFIGGGGAGLDCGSQTNPSGRATVVVGGAVHDNGQGAVLNCSELADPDSIGPCWSLKLEAKQCKTLLETAPICEEPSAPAFDACGSEWNARNRCLDFFSKARVTDPRVTDPSVSYDSQDLLNQVFKSYQAAAGGVGIVVDAPQVKIISGGPSAPGGVYGNSAADIYVNTFSPDAICRDSSLVFDVNLLQTALVSQVPVGNLVISRFPLQKALKVASSTNQGRANVYGFVDLKSAPWYPWNTTTVDISSLKAEVFYQNDHGFVFMGSAPVLAGGRFSVEGPIPNHGDNFKFVVSIVDEEHGNTAPFVTGVQSESGSDDDGDGLSNDEEDVNHNGIVDERETDPINPDTDQDGLTDGEEKLHTGRVELFINQGHSYAAIEKLDPLKFDSDGDCLPDGLELGVSKNDAEALVNKMTARARLAITDECRALLASHAVLIFENAIKYDESANTDINNIAMLFDLDPNQVSDPTSADTDKDGITDGSEDLNFNGQVDFTVSSDGAKVLAETSPSAADTDGDGIIDGEEGDRDDDGRPNPNETNALMDDTDGDGVKDGVEKRIGTYPNACDSDEDGLSDGVETGAVKAYTPGAACHGLEAVGANYQNPGLMDPLNPDSDGDGLLDGEEDANGNGWVDIFESDPSIEDSDMDGIPDGVENKGDFDRDGSADFDIRGIMAGPKCSPPPAINDLDCDGGPNATDVDSDNDGCPDSVEKEKGDQNANDIPDVYDAQVKECSSGGGSFLGGGAAQGSKPEEDSDVQKTPSWLTNAGGGGACSLMAMPDRTEISTIILDILIYLLVISALFIKRMSMLHRLICRANVK